jgi:hypothetical protein
MIMLMIQIPSATTTGTRICNARKQGNVGEM